MNKDLISSFLKKIKPGITEEKIDQLYKEYDMENLDENTVGLDMRNLLVSIGCAIASDWKWRPQDVLFALRVIVPGFQFDLKKADFDENSEKWDVEVEVCGKNLSFSYGMDQMDEFINLLNPIIFEVSGSNLEPFITGEDSYFYLLIPKNVSLIFEEEDLMMM
jgi:hypothetical protein